MPTDLQNQHVAECKVRVDDTELSQEASVDLLAATVQDDVDYPGCFSLTLNNWDPQQISMKWSDDDLFRVGKQVEVFMGPVGKTESLIVGEITGLELHLENSQAPPLLIVRGYDRAHRLTRGRRTTSYTNLKDSDIATRIADQYGFSAEVEATSETYAYLLQHDQTDAAFLRERAKRIDFELFVRDRKLVFRSRKNAEMSQTTLSSDTGLLDFHCRLSTMQQVTKVELRSWDLTSKKVWVGSASSEAAGSAMGGGQTGAALAEAAFGTAALSSAANPSASQSDVDQFAAGCLKRAALPFLLAEGTAVGRADLRAGTVTDVQGMGKCFSGSYYLTSTTHTYLPPMGYRTVFQARRNAA